MTDIQYGDKWKKDKLQRKSDADYLSSYLISKYKQSSSNLNHGSFVLNINAEWGFGKTYFLKNWADDLSEGSHPVVYFDAWKNDFSKEPLLAIISTINEQLTPYFDKKIGEKRGEKVKRYLSTWYESGKKLVAPSTPLILEILAKKLSGMTIDEITELMDEDDEESNETSSDAKKEISNTVSSVVAKAATKMMESHSSTKKTITIFKTNLEKLTTHLDSLASINIPMFIFIDELDRCRPNYAIEVLENIKHLFGVPGVFFIVATASEQLGHSIKAVYGQDFDSPNYLKRFFDQTYTMQEPDRYSFSEYLFSQYGLADRENIFSPLEVRYCTTNNSVTEAFALVTSLFNCGLRDMIQYCIIIDSISLTFESEKIHIIFIIILKDKRHEKYKSFLSKGRIDFSKLGLDRNIHQKPIITSGRNVGNKSVTITNIISLYIRFSTVNLPDIYEEDYDTQIYYNIRNALIENMPSSYSLNNTPQHFLSQYPLLIEQAGKIS